MKDEWIAKNPNTTEEMPVFEYYDFENYVLRNYYIYMTIFAQGLSFWWCVAYHFIPYRWWNLCGFLMHISCFPVDILIFYKEPFGPIGTLAAQVFGFIPFYFITGIQQKIVIVPSWE